MLLIDFRAQSIVITLTKEAIASSRYLDRSAWVHRPSLPSELPCLDLLKYEKKIMCASQNRTVKTNLASAVFDERF